ncbi:MAG: hypothetical protein HQL68_12150 [Magnetococcales bacterium]|nr:hypothetical protein [Magnetococcales bacterium]
MFSAIPAITTLSVNSPAAQVATLQQVSQELRTNGAEQLEARSVAALKAAADGQKVHRRNEDEERQKRQTQEKTSFQMQKKPLTPTQVSMSRAEPQPSSLSIDIMA